MSPSPSRNALPVVPLVIAGVVVLVGCVLIGVTLAIALGPIKGPATQVADNPPIATARPVIIFTSTPLPTSTPTDTPTPTETSTPTLTPTKTFVPVTRVPPTAVPPTDSPPTAIPPTPVPIGRGWLTDIRFEVPKTEISAGPPDSGIVPFKFYFFNARGVGWEFGCVGGRVFDVAGNFVKNQWSLGTSTLVQMTFNNGLSWEDSVKNMSPGSYKLQLWIRYDKTLCPAADVGPEDGGDWENLTPGGIQFNVH